MKFLFWNITRDKHVETTTETKICSKTLVVTGSCSKEALKELEDHASEKGQEIIATSVPILGVFNLDNPAIETHVNSGGVQKK